MGDVKNGRSPVVCFPWTDQLTSVTQPCLTLCNAMDCSMPGLPVHHQLLEFTQTHAHWVVDAIQPSHPLSSPSPPAFDLSQHLPLIFPSIRGFYNESVLHIRWPKFGVSASASVSVLPMNTQSWFPLGWLDLLAVHRTLKSLLQHHSSKASLLRCSTFFTVQLSQP